MTTTSIFIRDSDNFWYKFNNSSFALQWLEELDVENNEYQCWDVHGNSIEIGIDATGNIIFLIKESRATTELRDEMIRSIPANTKHKIDENLDIESLWKLVKNAQKAR